jgi:glycosyltransferase involved in cell wall biosynthesis
VGRVTRRAAIVVPCYDEEHRLDRGKLLAFADLPGIELLLVDDGSKDRTRELLEGLQQERPKRIRVLPLDTNGGKGEAVRLGLLRALDGTPGDAGAPIVGYTDADLSTPPEEMARLVERLEQAKVSVVVGSRVLLAGRKIERKFMRHALGRVFAGIADKILGVPFYDTQCGAKVFRDVPALRTALADPFTSRWAFDVELLGRLLAELPIEQFLEEPLREWIDAGGSKVNMSGMARTLVDLAKINAKLKKR